MRSDPPAPSSKLLPTHAIDTFSQPGHRAREIWQSIVDGTFELEGGGASDAGHRVSTQVWYLEDLMLASFSAEGNSVHRTRELIDRNPTPIVKVRIYRSGYSVLVDGDDQRTIGTGAIHFIDHDRPLRQVSTDHEQITLSVPYHVLGYDPSVHPACLSIGLETPRGRLLQAGLQALYGEIRGVTTTEAPALAASVSGLLRGAFRGSLDSQTDRDIRLARIAAAKQFIDRKLSDPGLGIDDLLRDLGASRATIYRDFAEEGGLNRYILERRLHRAYRLLAEAEPVRGAVQEVALRCGFASLPHFSRSFRESFAVSPSDVLGQWNGPGQEPARPDLTTAPVSALEAARIAALQWSYKRFR
jgi:AraC-like DNA-binding protein